MGIYTCKMIERRARLRNSLREGKLLRFPGAFSPLVGMMIEQLGFEGIYISGAVISNSLGLPDIGLTTMSEVLDQGRAIVRASNLPTLIDLDTGFGEVLNVVRTIEGAEAVGLCGGHLEDQQNPKRCGHLDHKQLVDEAMMVKKIQAATRAKKDPNFLIIARTDARSVEGLGKAIHRAKAYVDAGADMIFPESLVDEKEFELFREAIQAPLLANMTEFGKTKLLTRVQLSDLGYNIVIYPVTTLRLAMKAVEEGLKAIDASGTQEGILKDMQSRAELYKLLRYESFNQFDQDIFNFPMEGS